MSAPDRPSPTLPWSHRPRRALIVDGVRIEGVQARRVLRRAFLDAVRQTRVPLTRVVLPMMTLGGLLGGGTAIAFVRMRNAWPSPYDWLAPLTLVVAVAAAARIGARRAMMHAYRAEIRLAMQRLGFELCTGCGYWLKGLPDTEQRCPECGAPRRRLDDGTVGDSG